VGKKESLLSLLQTKYTDKTKDELVAHILCGEVRVNGERCLDPKTLMDNDSSIEIGESRRFVSRAGEKLDALLDEWKMDISGKVFIDAGCSTGGFTDCLLQRGAKYVYAVDVGVNQLDYSLRRNSRVGVKEKTNIVRLVAADLHLKPDAAVMDLSFRSVRGAAAHILPLLKEKWIVALIKPQFEWRNPPADFNGVVKERKHFLSILFSLIEDLHRERVYVNDITLSTLKGRKGNNEFFFLLTPKQDAAADEITRLVEAALRRL